MKRLIFWGLAFWPLLVTSGCKPRHATARLAASASDGNVCVASNEDVTKESDLAAISGARSEIDVAISNAGGQPTTENALALTDDIDSLKSDLQNLNQSEVDRLKADIKDLTKKAKDAKAAGNNDDTLRYLAEARKRLDTLETLIKGASSKPSMASDCAPLVPEKKKHWACRADVDAGRSDLVDGAHHDSLEKHSFSAYALDFEANGDQALEQLARSRLRTALQLAYKQQELSREVTVGESASMSRKICRPAGMTQDDPDFDRAIQCQSIEDTRIEVLNQTAREQWTGDASSPCAAVDQSLVQSYKRLKFPLPTILFCYFNVDKTRQFVDGALSVGMSSQAGASSEAGGSSSAALSSPNGLRRLLGTRDSTAYYSNNWYHDAQFRNDVSMSVDMKINTHYERSSSFIIEQTQSAEGYKDIAVLKQDTCNKALERYLAGNSVNDVLTGCYCTSERIVPKELATVYKVYPY